MYACLSQVSVQNIPAHPLTLYMYTVHAQNIRTHPLNKTCTQFTPKREKAACIACVNMVIKWCAWGHPQCHTLLFIRSEMLRVCYTTLDSAYNEFALYKHPAFFLS